MGTTKRPVGPNYVPNRVTLTIIESLLLGFVGIDRLYMGFPAMALLKLALFVGSVVTLAYYAQYGLICTVLWLLVGIADYVWVMAFSIGGSSLVPFYTLKRPAYWDEGAGRCNSCAGRELCSSCGAKHLDQLEWSRGIALALVMLPFVLLYLFLFYSPDFSQLPNSITNPLTTEDREFLKADTTDPADTHLISFANGCCEVAHGKMSASAKEAGVTHHKYDLESATPVLPPHIVQRIKEIPIGAGLWSWKPHLLKHHMNTTPEGTVLLYGDTSIRLKAPGNLIAEEVRNCGGALFFEIAWTMLSLKSTVKTDVVLAAGLDPVTFREEHGGDRCVLAAFVGLENNAKNRLLVDQWIALMDRTSLLDTTESKGGRDPIQMLFNGYDQSILSLLARTHYPGRTNPAIQPCFSHYGHRLIALDSTHRNSVTKPSYIINYTGAMFQSQARKVITFVRPGRRFEHVEPVVHL